MDEQQTEKVPKWVFPLCPVFVALLVYTIYVSTRQFPAEIGGLFFVVSEQVLEQGYSLPAHIPYYTEGGLPFAYPPFIFYVLAALQSIGFSPVTLALYLPGAVLTLSMVPLYYFTDEVLNSRAQASAATALTATTPFFFISKIIGAGTVRAPAFLFSVTGFFIGYRLFRTHELRYLFGGVGCFTLTVLTHPQYAVFFGITYLALYIGYDRSKAGLVQGTVVALGGALLATPWWVPVVQTHGIDIFFLASGSWGGILNPLYLLDLAFVEGYADLNAIVLTGLLPFVFGTIYLVARRRFFLPVWLLAVGVVLGGRWFFIPAVIISIYFVVEAFLPLIRETVTYDRDYRLLLRTFVAGLVLVGGVSGILYASSTNPTGTEPAMQTHLNVENREAMIWVREQTSRSAQFLVTGKVAEWFPLFAHRTILVSPWGSEWTGKAQKQSKMYHVFGECEDAACYTRMIQESDLRPNYVYIQKENVRVNTFQEADTYETSFENSEVTIFEYSKA
jgi:hypothetical protein